MSDEERPKHYKFDAETGEWETIEVTDEEWEEIRKKEAATEQDNRKAAEEVHKLREQVENHPDPVVRALAKQAGIL